VLRTPLQARAAAQRRLGEYGDTPGRRLVDRVRTARAATSARQTLTFAAFVDQHYAPWATAQRRTGTEQAARLRAIFGPTLDALRLDEITPFVIERWRSGRLIDGKSSGTVNRDLNTLRGALSRAVEWGLVAAHPLATVKASKEDRAAIVRYLSRAEEKRLRAALTARDTTRRAERASANAWRRERAYALWPEHDAYTDHLTPIVLLALNTGLRRGELFGLRWADVDLVRAIVTVQGGGAKSGQTRHVPLNSEAVAVLQAWRPTDADPAAYVFPGDSGARLEDIKSAWLPLVSAAKVPAFRFHDLRHTFASNLVQAGIDLNTVRELLGHADLQMTLRYAHLAPEHKASAVATLVRA
jgi:integrase